MSIITARYTLASLLCLTLHTCASASTWRDPAYGGVYDFKDDKTVVVSHASRQFTGKWWYLDRTKIQFRFFGPNGRPLGVNTLEMADKSSANVKLAGGGRVYRWSNVESRGGGQSTSLADSGWFMESIGFHP